MAKEKRDRDEEMEDAAFAILAGLAAFVRGEAKIALDWNGGIMAIRFEREPKPSVKGEK